MTASWERSRQAGPAFGGATLNAVDLLLAGSVVFTAAFLRGYSGFGFSTVLMAGLIFWLPASQIAPMSIALEIIASLGQSRSVLRDVERRALAYLLLAGLIGNPIGVALLDHVPDQAMRIGVHVLIIGAVLTLLLRPIRPTVPTAMVLSLAGFIAGVVNGATAMSGLVLGLFFTTTAISSRAMRATMIAYFFFTDLWAGALLTVSGHYSGQILWHIAAALPLLFIGLWLGSICFARYGSHDRRFRRIVLWLLLALCLIGLGRALL
ncbi:sulfite exporter TauE/SafE family protein [Phaeobacter gallaeciensis]|uniref:sulfite exporter TauE/SafE family protein n=1 Tax=Phaeobacter gallaeciensis TaxID=60890 RepID=UPI00237F7F6F|nr:sulfite exporter TauE/SafE family protein [Phaeobacter gallaeciensis]MDE4120121.1 sulfite exporter TauE/SafE family protein [Phaeobacter gallaeciensis]